jgi:hypothetical protein
MRTLDQVWAIAQNTLREAVRNKVLFGLLFFALLMIVSGVIVSSLSYVESARILQDVGLAAIRLFGVAMAIFLGIEVISREVERRTVFSVLAKPISRGAFLIGKFLGLTLTIWLQVALMGLAFAAVSLLAGAPLGAVHAAFLLMVAAELALVVAIATLFSAFTTPLLAAFFTTGLWLVGGLSRELRDIGAASDSAWVESSTWWLHRLLPDLQNFDIAIEAAHGLPVEASQLLWALAYGTGYVALLLFIGVAVFQRRQFR